MNFGVKPSQFMLISFEAIKGFSSGKATLSVGDLATHMKLSLTEAQRSRPLASACVEPHNSLPHGELSQEDAASI